MHRHTFTFALTSLLVACASPRAAVQSPAPQPPVVASTEAPPTMPEQT
ncbi:MAG: hypothetical protein SFX73_05645 [Kofleriaceae bacterium]|nr:hypothetical protein [Kofleriaceae bacterium]